MNIEYRECKGVPDDQAVKCRTVILTRENDTRELCRLCEIRKRRAEKLEQYQQSAYAQAMG